MTRKTADMKGELGSKESMLSLVCERSRIIDQKGLRKNSDSKAEFP